MFNLDNFVGDCRAAQGTNAPQLAITELLQKALENPAEVVAAVGEPTEGGIKPVYKSADLTIVNLIWQPSMTL